MTASILQRIHALASTDDAVSKAHAIAGALREFDAAGQDAIVRAIEALNE
ncbi:MAG: hypothetical protein WAT39_01440 [Planctomycetota bacterium]